MLRVCSTRPVHGHREVQLEVAGGVPGERADPAVGADAQGVEHAAEPSGPLGPGAVGGALRPGRGGRDHLLVGVQALGPPEEVRERQGEVLHEATHVGSFVGVGMGGGVPPSAERAAHPAGAGVSAALELGGQGRGEQALDLAQARRRRRRRAGGCGPRGPAAGPGR